MPTAVQSALVLIRLVVLEDMLNKLVIRHPFFAFVQFCSRLCFTDELALMQVLNYVFNVFAKSSGPIISATQASFLVIFIEHFSACVTTGTIAVVTELWLIDSAQAGRAHNRVKVDEL